jgi:hypothetical protein
MKLTNLTPFSNLISDSISVAPTNNPNWVTGFTDAEVSFIISVSKRSNSNSWVVRPSFELGLHSKDKDTLQKIKNFLVVGRICNRKTRDMVSFAVTKIKDLTTVIIPHFYSICFRNNYIIVEV